MEASTVYENALKAIRRSGRMNLGMMAMRERMPEFSTREAAELAGIAVVPEAREFLDDKLDEFWAGPDADVYGVRDGRYPRELVIGAGLHAAIYCAVRVQLGFRKPVVLETGRIGGAFAMSRKPSFRLNSRNRPGLIGSSTDPRAQLNYLPGAPVQISDFSMAEFPTNADLAWIVRVMLAKYANVISGVEALSVVQSATDGLFVRMETSEIFPRRVIDARGLGVPLLEDTDGKQVQTAAQFLGSMDRTFPLRGLRRVAVIGGGDSGKVCVEALLGIGPSAGMSPAALDFVQQIDWYSEDIPGVREEWRLDNGRDYERIRGRYQRLGGYLPRDLNAAPDRLRVIRERGSVSRGFDTALVNGRTYDRVIVATGYQLPTLGLDEDYFASYLAPGSTTIIASEYRRGADIEGKVFRIGPAANLALTSAERRELQNQGQSKVAIFRLANRTATLAATLGGA